MYIPAKKTCLLMLIVMATATVSGCTSSEVKEYNATATITIKDLPQSYYNLDEKVRKKFEVSVSIDDTDVELKESNNFTQAIFLKPGEYNIQHSYTYPDAIATFDVDLSRASVFTISRNQDTPVELPIKELPAYEPAAEILDAPAFSHKIQVNDSVYDMENIPDAFSFDMSSPLKREAEGNEYRAFSANEVDGLYLLANSDDESNTPVGLCFERRNIKLWDGITVGENIMTLSENGKGLKNHLAFCKGSPILGMGFDDTDFVFMGDEGNDRLDLLAE